MKTKKQPVSEVKDLHQRVAELGALEIERQQAEEAIEVGREALPESEERFQRLAEEARDIIYRVQLVPNLRIEYVSPAATTITGYTPEEYYAVPGLGFKLIHPDDQPLLESLLRGDTPLETPLVFRWVRKDGTVIWTELHNTPVYNDAQNLLAIEGIARDVTKRARAELELRRNLEERLATEEALRQRNRELALLNSASQTLSSSLEMDKVLVFVLEEVRRLLNVVACSVWLIDSDTDELVCRQATDPKSHIIRGWRLAPGEGLAGWVARTGESLTVPDVHADERYFRGVDRETGLQLRSILTVPLKVKQNVIGVIQAVDTEVDRFDATDLTLLESLAASAAIAIENARLYDQVESYAVEMGARVAERTRELTEAYKRLKELDRLKSKFVSDVSHELRTPVANIKLYLHLLERGKVENRSHHMDVLNDQCDRLVQLVEDILSLSRLELGKQGESEFTSVDLNAVIEQAMAAHRPQAEAAGLELVFERGEGLPPVQSERNQLAQVVTNLVINAINYTPAGQVLVTTGLDRERKQVCLEVQDTGTGIKSEDMPYIFDRFYRGKDVGSSTIPGTGLGLAIVKEIVALHGGSIDVESQEGEGSTFRVWLPLAS